MQAGTARLHADGPDFHYARLGSRAVTLSDVQGLIRFMETLPATRPLLLASSCPGFQPSLQAETAGLVFYAGCWRRMQESRKHQGVRMVSFIEGIAVGGTYLMHGLSAEIRLATADSAFYDTVCPGRTVPLEAALAQGLVTEILEPNDALERLSQALFGVPSS